MAQFHVELGLNISLPQENFSDAYDGGLGGYLEPKYALNENIDLGLLIGVNVFAGISEDALIGQRGSVEIDALTVSTFLATGTYRFSTKGVTPYAGLGLGIYAIEGASVGVTIRGMTTTAKEDGDTKFGFAPRAGVYLGRVNLGVSYHIVKDVNFLQFNLGVRIGRRGDKSTKG